MFKNFKLWNARRKLNQAVKHEALLRENARYMHDTATHLRQYEIPALERTVTDLEIESGDDFFGGRPA